VPCRRRPGRAAVLLVAAVLVVCGLTWAPAVPAATFSATASTLPSPASEASAAVTSIALGNSQPGLLATYNNNSVEALANGGSTIGSTGQQPNTVVTGRLNGSGGDVVLVASGAQSVVSVFTPSLAPLTGYSASQISEAAFPEADLDDPIALAIGDLNGDGLPDLAVANAGDGTVQIFYDTGAGTANGVAGAFTVGPLLTVGGDPTALAIGDLNGDDHPDLAVTNSAATDDAGDGSMSLFVADPNGDGGYATQTVATGVSPSSVAIGDLSGNDVGGQDLAATNFGDGSTAGTVTLYLKDPSDDNYATTTLPTGVAPGGVAIADLDGDGLEDFAVEGSGTVTVFLKDTTDAGFTPTTLNSTGTDSLTRIGDVVIGDLTGDGKPDIVTTNTGSSSHPLTLFTSTPPRPAAFEADTPQAAASIGRPYAYQFVASGLPAPSFAVVSGSLPDGLSLDPSTGLLSGTPLAPGSFVFKVKAANGSGADAVSGSITITVTGTPAAPVFTADTPPAEGNPAAYFNYLFVASGNPAPTFSLASGNLPSFGTGSGIQSDGKLVIPGQAQGTSYAFRIRASNGVAPDAVSPPITITFGTAPYPPVFASGGTGPADDTPPPAATVGAAYPPYTFGAVGSPTPTYGIASGALPGGLGLDPASGVLSGTPTTAGTFMFTVRAANGMSPDATTQPITITVGGAAPALTADSPPTGGTVGGDYSYTFAATGNPAPTFAVASGALPVGLSLNAASGVLAGSPTTPGSATFTVAASNAAGPVATSPPITVTTRAFTADSPPTSANVGAPYSYTFAASGTAADPPRFSFGSGTPPDGLTLDGNTGVLSGTPTASGTFTFSLGASYEDGATASSGPITITVPPASVAPAFTADAPPALLEGGAADSYVFAASGSPSPNFSVASGSLPPGLRLARFTGQLSGVPTAPGTYTFTIGASNGVSPDATSASVSITVTAGSIVAPSLTADSPPATGTVGSAYAGYSFAATGDPVPSFALASGALPGGLSLDPANGVLAGTPTTAGTFTFTVKALNGAPPDAVSDQITITVSPAPAPAVFTADAAPSTATVGSAYGPYAFRASGFPLPTFALTAGALPDGLSLDSASGVLSGTPTTPGTYTFTVGASNGLGHDAASVTITVAPAPAAPVFSAEAPPAAATVGSGYSYSFVASGSPAPTFAVASGALPSGLSLDSATGLLSGTPSLAGSSTFSVKATNGVSPDATSGSITIAVAPAGLGPLVTPPLAPPPTPPKPGAPAKPSNVIRFSSVKAAGKGVITITVAIPGAGRLVVRSTAKFQPKKSKHAKKAPKARTITYAASLAAARSAKATVPLRITPGKTAAATLKTYKTLHVVISVTFTPVGGTAHTQTDSATARR